MALLEDKEQRHSVLGTGPGKAGRLSCLGDGPWHGTGSYGLSIRPDVTSQSMFCALEIPKRDRSQGQESTWHLPPAFSLTRQPDTLGSGPWSGPCPLDLGL